MQDPENDGIILFRDAAIGYPGEPPVLSGVSLNALPGEMVALIGRNGSGKSTLLRTIAGMLPLKEGIYSLRGAPLSAYDIRKRARLISLVSSRAPALPSMTIGEVVIMGRIPHTGWMGRYGKPDREMVRDALHQLGLQELAHRQVDHVSDGERQRAMIARAFVQDTPVMLLDEPTAFLDLPARFELTGVMAGFRESGKTLVYATHDLEMALMHADRLWVIDRGKVVEGGPEDLGLSGLFDRLFQDEGIVFDHGQHRFIRGIVRKGTFTLSGGNELVRGWTGNAMNRIGFMEAGGTGPDPPGSGNTVVPVTVEGEDPAYRWIITRDGQQFSFDRLYTLVQFLTRIE